MPELGLNTFKKQHEFLVGIDSDGCVSAPDGPGLGLDIDWKQIESDATLVIDTETL